MLKTSFPILALTHLSSLPCRAECLLRGRVHVVGWTFVVVDGIPVATVARALNSSMSGTTTLPERDETTAA